MFLENEIAILDSYAFVIDFVPEYTKEKHVSKAHWSTIKTRILEGWYADNPTSINNDLEYLKDWFGLIAYCLNRLFLKSLEIIEVVLAMKSITDYFEAAKVMQTLDSL